MQDVQCIHIDANIVVLVPNPRAMDVEACQGLVASITKLIIAIHITLKSQNHT